MVISDFHNWSFSEEKDQAILLFDGSIHIILIVKDMPFKNQQTTKIGFL